MLTAMVEVQPKEMLIDHEGNAATIVKRKTDIARQRSLIWRGGQDKIKEIKGHSSSANTAVHRELCEKKRRKRGQFTKS